MTPEEAIEIIYEKHMDMEFYFAEHDRYPKYYDFEFDQATLIAAQALKELQQYREIGTVEECREAMEKQMPKKPRDVEYDHSYFVCDNCGTAIYTSDEFDGHHYCLNCGQAIEWPDMNLEGMKDE